MSTPTRRLPNLTELSFVPQWAREQSEQADNQLRPTDAVAHDPLASPYAPKHKLARSSAVPDAPSPIEPSLPLQDMHLSGDIGQKSVGPQDEIVDLERLETALRWLQCEAAAGRFRSPPLLEPERMAPPPARAPRHAQRWLLTALLAATAAPLVYYVSADSLVSSSTSVAPLQIETVGRSFDAPRSRQEVTGSIGFRDRYPGTSITPPISPRQAGIIRPELTPAVETMALPAPQSSGAEMPRPTAPARTLDREDIALLVRQGDQLMSAGDIAAARTVFQRAAEAGDAAAAVALAASYDPTVLKQLGVVGMNADLKKARNLYEKAERLGSAEATRRLHMLARQ